MKKKYNKLIIITKNLFGYKSQPNKNKEERIKNTREIHALPLLLSLFFLFSLGKFLDYSSLIAKISSWHSFFLWSSSRHPLSRRGRESVKTTSKSKSKCSWSYLISSKINLSHWMPDLTVQDLPTARRPHEKPCDPRWTVRNAGSGCFFFFLTWTSGLF